MPEPEKLEKLIRDAQRRGTVTYAELDAVMPFGRLSSGEIEDLFARLAERGITVVDGRGDQSP